MGYLTTACRCYFRVSVKRKGMRINADHSGTCRSGRRDISPSGKIYNPVGRRAADQPINEEKLASSLAGKES